FLDFFEKHGHRIVPSSSLLPTDQSVLFTTAGMQQFKPYYLGEKSPYGDNVASCQKCIRTSDIEEVGDKRHLTFFEMLGNFSFGGYFKEEAIKLAYEFITKELKLKIDYVTIFSPEKVEKGDWRAGVSEDKDSFKIWEKLGVKDIRKEGVDNFWGPTGEEGPCGPTTEIYVNGIEIWNIVFNEFFCDKNKKLEKLKQEGVDTGMGLERLAAVVQKKETIFETDLFDELIKKIEELSSLKYTKNEKLYRIVADHIKASIFLVSDGIVPSNLGQGYILRRLLRRQIRCSHSLTMKNDYAGLFDLIDEQYGDFYPSLRKNKELVISELEKEFSKFILTLKNGLKEFEKIYLNTDGSEANVNGEKIFYLYQTYGFPPELSLEEIKRAGFRINEEKIWKEFFEESAKHQEFSRTASAGMFKGGLADASLETTKLHTAAHLMLAGLRKVLGEHVVQKGSNITAERLRFDFSHSEKMTNEQIKDVENFVNGIIEKDLPVSFEEMTLEDAKKLNAMGVFESKYGDKVKVYTIGSGDEITSREICGGPHVERTGILGRFKIVKEESSSSGVRRIKAILE
ncbi:MAG: Alanine-tRNA ligase, partial [Parcubacteria group bacterium GW2011_GWA1_36_12]